MGACSNRASSILRGAPRVSGRYSIMLYRRQGSTDGAFVETDLFGYDLLNDPLLNKGTAFSEEERDIFELHGLLPPHVATLDEQVTRRMQAFQQLPSDLERYVFLRGL